MDKIIILRSAYNFAAFSHVLFFLGSLKTEASAYSFQIQNKNVLKEGHSRYTENLTFSNWNTFSERTLLKLIKGNFQQTSIIKISLQNIELH